MPPSTKPNSNDMRKRVLSLLMVLPFAVGCSSARPVSLSKAFAYLETRRLVWSNSDFAFATNHRYSISTSTVLFDEEGTLSYQFLGDYQYAYTGGQARLESKEMKVDAVKGESVMTEKSLFRVKGQTRVIENGEERNYDETADADLWPFYHMPDDLKVKSLNSVKLLLRHLGKVLEGESNTLNGYQLGKAKEYGLFTLISGSFPEENFGFAEGYPKGLEKTYASFAATFNNDLISDLALEYRVVAEEENPALAEGTYDGKTEWRFTY